MSLGSYSFDYQALIESASPNIITSYRSASILELLITEDVGGVEIDEWAHAYILETQEAAWSASGFNPNAIAIDLKSFKVNLGTFGQDMTLTEKQKNAFSKNQNLIGISYDHLGEDTAKAANRAIWTGKDINGNYPFGSSVYEFIKAMGTDWNTNVATTVAAEIAATGTAVRPKLAAIVDGNDWSTYTNFDNDRAKVIGDMVAHGCNKSTIVAFYPSNLESVMIHQDSQYQGKTRKQVLLDMGILAVLPYPEELATGIDGSTPASTAKFDMWFVDLTKVPFGVTRDLTINAFPGDLQGRSVKLTAELWGGLCIIPIPKKIGTTQYYFKGVGVIAEASAS